MVAEDNRDRWLETAKALEPTIQRWREVSELERRLPAELFEAIKSHGFFRSTLPRAYGGEQVAPTTLTEVVEEIARQDGSVAWNVMIGAVGGGFADYLSEPATREVFAGDGVVVGSFGPTGQAVPVNGGYRASGRWAFGSGCQNAAWLSGGFIVLEDGKPKAGADGYPEIRIMFFPAKDCEILDTWYTAGMRGTGSHDFQVHDLFIPEHLGFSFDALFRGPGNRSAVGYTQPFLPHLVAPAMAAVALGIARDAIDSFKELAGRKTPAGSTSSLAAQHTTHLRLGKAEALLRSARAYLYDTVRQVEAVKSWTPEVVEEWGAAVRLAATHAAQSSTEAVDLMYEAAGGTSVYSSSRLERCFRDIHVATHHILLSPSNIEMVGQYLLGMGLQMRR